MAAARADAVIRVETMLFAIEGIVVKFTYGELSRKGARRKLVKNRFSFCVVFMRGRSVNSA